MGILGTPLRLFNNGRGYSNFDAGIVRETLRATLASVDQVMNDWADTAVWFSLDDEIEGQAKHGTLKKPADESLDDDLLAELAMELSK